METAIAIIDKRIEAYENEIEGFELSDTSFINSKRIKYLGDLIRELTSVKDEIIAQK